MNARTLLVSCRDEMCCRDRKWLIQITSCHDKYKECMRHTYDDKKKCRVEAIQCDSDLAELNKKHIKECGFFG